MTHSKSRLYGAIMLVAGTTIGAAILAIPVSTGRAGFFPSIAIMVCIWAYLVLAALYLVEVNLSMPHKGNIISMANATLGSLGKYVAWSAYLFLLYALVTAYIAGSTSVLQDMIERITGSPPSKMACILPLLGIFGILLRHGMNILDHINRIFMACLFFTFIALVVISVPHIDTASLKVYDLNYVLPSLSVVLTAFGFHVIIPSLSNYLHGSVRELRLAIWIGSVVPLLGYIVWQCVTLGTAPATGDNSLLDAYASGKNGAQLIAAVAGSNLVSTLAEAFAISAIITSFMGVSISLFDFLADGLKVEKRAQGKWMLFFFTFVPPLYFSLTSPTIFFTALEIAGSFGVVILLALLPALMCWSKRYVVRLQLGDSSAGKYQVAGGKPLLILFILISIILIGIEIMQKLK